MNEHMIDELLIYSMNNKLIDQRFLKRNIKRLINDEGLIDYISRIKMKRKNFNGVFRIPELIEYNRDNNNLTIYEEEVNLYYRLYKVYDDLFNDSEKTLFYNLMIMKTILHELEHINQHKKIEENNDLESDILNACYLDDNVLSPIDRLANYEANKKILNIFKTDSKLHSYFEDEKTNDLIDGYTYPMVFKHESPTINYLRDKDSLDILSKYDWYSTNVEELYNNLMSEMALEERLKYGLPISEEEMTKVLVKYSMSKKAKMV